MSDHEARNKPFPVLVGARRGKTEERNKERDADLLLYFLCRAQLTEPLEEPIERMLKHINMGRNSCYTDLAVQTFYNGGISDI